MLSLAEQLAADFLTEYRTSGVYSRDRIERLTDLVTHKDRQIAESATKALFTELVERLADSFEPEAVSLYNRLFAQIIHALRADSRSELLSKVIDLELEQFGLSREQDLIARAERLRTVSPLTLSGNSPRLVRRIIVLSRVTIGADIAITSVIIARMKRNFPEAEIVLVGGTKGLELFGGDPRISFKTVAYGRAATTIERLLTWIDLLRSISELTHGLRSGEYLIVDPDSRLTQLGLLPIEKADAKSRISHSLGQDHVSPDREYLFFPSREYGSGTSLSLSELTSLWLDEVFRDTIPTYPRVSLRSVDIEAARDLINRIRRGSQPTIAINFGTGENQLKRIDDNFESALVASLIKEDAVIVLDKGAGEAETNRANAVIAEARRIERAGVRVRVVEINEQDLMGAASSKGLDADILVWNGRIGMLAGLIAESDLYIGYDSAGQHIAAALGVKCIDVFAGFSSPRMVDRWRPSGRAETQLVAVDTLGGGGNSNEVLARVLRHASVMLGRSKSF